MNAEEREIIRVKRGLLKEQSGYYDTPIVEGALTTDTGKPEIIGFMPYVPLQPVDLEAMRAAMHEMYRRELEA